MLNAIERNLLVTSSISAFSQGLLGPLFAVFTQRIGGNVMDISWAWSVYFIVTGILVYLIAHWSNGSIERRKRLLVTGYSLHAVLYFSYSFVQTPVHLLLVQVGLGFAVAMTNPTWSSLFSHYVRPHHAGSVWGMASCGYFILTGVALLLGGYIVQYHSFHGLFLLMGVTMALTALNQSRIFWLQAPTQHLGSKLELVESVA